VFCLLRVGLRPSLADFLERGGRKVGEWTAQHRHALVDFDDARAFRNANTAADLEQLEASNA
jgi:molybdopterin-guanine dinucleotide biosynthesis protein A